MVQGTRATKTVRIDGTMTGIGRVPGLPCVGVRCVWLQLWAGN
jgi:hypothetical protein